LIPVIIQWKWLNQYVKNWNELKYHFITDCSAQAHHSLEIPRVMGSQTQIMSFADKSAEEELLSRQKNFEPRRGRGCLPV